jgi:beta-fructofuranosidase
VRLANGWAGMMSLPRQLSLGPDGSLVSLPAAEVESLRAVETKLAGLILAAGQETLLPLSGDSFEIQVEFETGAAICGVKLACSPGGEEETEVGYDSQTRQVYIDRKKSSRFEGVIKGEPIPSLATSMRQGGGLDLAPGETLWLRIFYDRSIIEVFANDRLAMTSRIYPSLPNALRVKLFTSGGSATVKSIQFWNMKSIW